MLRLLLTRHSNSNSEKADTHQDNSEINNETMQTLLSYRNFFESERWKLQRREEAVIANSLNVPLSFLRGEEEYYIDQKVLDDVFPMEDDERNIYADIGYDGEDKYWFPRRLKVLSDAIVWVTERRIRQKPRKRDLTFQKVIIYNIPFLMAYLEKKDSEYFKGVTFVQIAYGMERLKKNVLLLRSYRRNRPFGEDHYHLSNERLEYYKLIYGPDFKNYIFDKYLFYLYEMESEVYEPLKYMLGENDDLEEVLEKRAKAERKYLRTLK